MADLRDFKSKGHELMDEYRALAKVSSDEVYAILKVKMKGKAWHFWSMNDKQTITLACGHLKKMIVSVKYKNLQ